MGHETIDLLHHNTKLQNNNHNHEDGKDRTDDVDKKDGNDYGKKNTIPKQNCTTNNMNL